jgi:hypothetical protein
MRDPQTIPVRPRASLVGCSPRRCRFTPAGPSARHARCRLSRQLRSGDDAAHQMSLQASWLAKLGKNDLGAVFPITATAQGSACGGGRFDPPEVTQALKG